MEAKRFMCIIMGTMIFLLSIGQPFVLSCEELRDTCGDNVESERTINVALLLQRWDYMDLLLRVFVAPFYTVRFIEIENKYGITCNFYVFWDSKSGGDVQDGKLEELNIDIAFGPGGVGAWCSPEKYRDMLKKFIGSGGGFLGACGDAYFGTVGAVNLPDDYNQLIKRLFGFEEMTPPLNLVDVYYDVSPFAKTF